MKNKYHLRPSLKRQNYTRFGIFMVIILIVILSIASQVGDKLAAWVMQGLR